MIWYYGKMHRFDTSVFLLHFRSRATHRSRSRSPSYSKSKSKRNTRNRKSRSRSYSRRTTPPREAFSGGGSSRDANYAPKNISHSTGGFSSTSLFAELSKHKKAREKLRIGHNQSRESSLGPARTKHEPPEHRHEENNVGSKPVKSEETRNDNSRPERTVDQYEEKIVVKVDNFPNKGEPEPLKQDVRVVENRQPVPPRAQDHRPPEPRPQEHRPPEPRPVPVDNRPPEPRSQDHRPPEPRPKDQRPPEPRPPQEVGRPQQQHPHPPLPHPQQKQHQHRPPPSKQQQQAHHRPEERRAPLRSHPPATTLPQLPLPPLGPEEDGSDVDSPYRWVSPKFLPYCLGLKTKVVCFLLCNPNKVLLIKSPYLQVFSALPSHNYHKDDCMNHTLFEKKNYPPPPP